MEETRNNLRIFKEQQNEEDSGIELQREILNEETRDPFIITFFLNPRDEIIGFLAKGTTGFVQYGFDIIAAGVSALTINTAQAVMDFTTDEPEVEVSKHYVKCIIKKRLSRESKVLMKTLRLGIQEIQNNYGTRYITIEEIKINSKGFFGLLS